MVEKNNVEINASTITNAPTTQQVSFQTNNPGCEFHLLLRCSSSPKQVSSQSDETVSSEEKALGGGSADNISGSFSPMGDKDTLQQEGGLGGEVAVSVTPNSETPANNRIEELVVVSKMLRDCKTFLETPHLDSTICFARVERFAIQVML